MHVLILNTHPLQSQFIQKALRYENIGADVCHPENLHKIWYGQYDGILLPLQTQNMQSSTALIHEVLKLGKVPLIILTKKLARTKIEALLPMDHPIQIVSSDLPFHQISEMIKTASYPQPTSPEKQVRIGELEIDFATHSVRRGTKIFRLRNKEFALLTCLIQNAGKVLTRTFILETVWDRNTSILSNTVDVHINRLRTKIDYGFRYSMIRTFPCIGYALIPQDKV